jgi:predicted phage terminase large subunit-like protein
MFPSGATLTFGYLRTEADKYRYQGAEFQFVGFDELTQFNETQYRYLLSRLRRLQGSHIPIRARGASNPGGVGHEWVRTNFVDDPIKPFIPAKLSDNPYLDQDEYMEALKLLDPVTRQQLLDGNWSAKAEGSIFDRRWFEIISPHDVPEKALSRKVRYWDFAATEPSKRNTDPDWTAGCAMCELDGVFYILDMQHFRSTPKTTEERVARIASSDGRTSTQIWIEEEPGSSGKIVTDHYKRRVLKGYICRGHRETGNKVRRALPFSAAAEAGNVKIVRGAWVASFLDELEAFPEGSHDDQVDAASGAFARLVKRPGQQAVAG